MNGDLSLVSEIISQVWQFIILNSQIASDGTVYNMGRGQSSEGIAGLSEKRHSASLLTCYMISPPLMNEEIQNRQNDQEADFTIVYHLTSLDRNEDIRIKAALTGEYPLQHQHNRHLAFGQLVRT